MKRLIILLLVLPSLCSAIAPERILPKTLVIRPTSWYVDQAKAWKQESSDHRSRADAWFNYYMASLFAQESRESLERIMNAMIEAIPNSYELLVVEGWHEGFKPEAYQAVQKAYAMKPEKPEAYGLLQSFSEFNLDVRSRAMFSESLFNNNQISSSLINYSYNVLMSLEPSSVLITEGESTTTPLYVLQDVMNIRKDVLILNLDMLTDATYLDKKFKNVGLSYSTNGPISGEGLRRDLCAHLPSANGGKKFYYALTIAKENVNSIKEYLYVVGLASLHSLINVDNVTQIKKNLEKEFLMDYLQVDFKGESKNDAGRIFSPNYLLPMILLYESYQKEGAVEKAKKLRELMEKIAIDSGKEEMIANFLGEKTEEEIPYFPFAIDAKSWDNGFRLVSDKIYAYEAEVTNEQYNRFLEYLKKNNLTDLYEKCKFDYSDYTEPALSLMRNYSADRVASKKFKGFNNYPAVNISYDAANAFCEWLTQQYNRSAEHKFKKVKFRLPSIKEWQIAAVGIKNPTSWEPSEQKVEVRYTAPGKEFDKNYEKRIVSLSDADILYPWFKYYNLRSSPINNKGCYLGNFKAPDQISCPGIKKNGFGAADGFFAMSLTKAYFPNDIGLFDVVGNVAEMTNEKGKACGGSWNHPPAESTIKSINSYTKSDAAIGFRIFMEIMEK
jgi:formylglycine-generating enzyme required for sulfatase activity